MLINYTPLLYECTNVFHMWVFVFWFTCLFHNVYYLESPTLFMIHIFLYNYIVLVISFGCHVFVLEPNHDVYKEVVKPLVEKARLEVETMVFKYILIDLPFKQRIKIDLDCEEV